MKFGSEMEPNNNRFLKVISLALVGSFLLEQLAFAAPDIKPLNLDFLTKPKISLDIPESVATIEDSWLASERVSGSTDLLAHSQTRKLVYLIQDAHTNTSGQLNLARTLDHLLQKDKNLKYVFLEAGLGNNSLSFFKQYGSKEERRSIAEPYLRKGLL